MRSSRGLHLRDPKLLHRNQHEGLLLRSGFALAARHEREHQRSPTPIPAPPQRPQRLEPGRPHRDRRRTQRTTQQSLDGDTPSERMATSLDTAYTSLLRRSLGSKFPESGFPRPGRQDGLLVLGAARLKYRRVDVRHPDVRWCQAEGLNNVTGDDGPITLGVAGRQADLLVEREPAHP